MHCVKSRARHMAWNATDGVSRFIPFAGRAGPRQRIGDVEQREPYRHQRRGSNHSENCAPLPDEQDHIDSPRDFHHPNHATTLPPNFDAGQSTPNFEHKHTDTGHTATTGASSEKPLTAVVGDGTGPRRRGKFASLFHSKSEADVLERQVSTKSKGEAQPEHFTIGGQLRAVFWTPVNILLVCVPIGIALAKVGGIDGKVVFVINFLAIIPLAGILSYATEEIAMRVGETLGGLLNASFGNAVELIVSIIALIQNEITVVKTSLIGSIFSNLLLVLGMCFFLGGINRREQFFNKTVAQTAASLLALAVGALLIPTFFDQGSNNAGSDAERAARVPELSRATAVILLFIYFCYLLFQLRTHTAMYNEPSQKSPKKSLRSKVEDGAVIRGLATIGAGSAAVPSNSGQHETVMSVKSDEEDEVPEVPQLSLIGSIVTLCGATALVGVCAEFLVSSISDITRGGGISVEFVGLILLPIVGNAAEHATAVTVAIKDKMDLAIGVAVGSSLQIALLVLPLVTIIGWGMGNEEMTLEFDVFLIGMLFVAILIVNYLIQDGASHWLEGVLLMMTYILIAVAAWFYPADPTVLE